MTVDIKAMRQCARLASALLKEISNEHRLLILFHLMEGEKYVGQFNGVVDVSQSVLSQHLARLRRDNVVTTRREGTRVYYSLSSQAVVAVIEAVQREFAR